MQHVVLRIRESVPEPSRAWVAELWSGFPEAIGANPAEPATRLAGGQSAFTERDLVATTAAGRALDRATVLSRIREQELDDAVFAEIGNRLYALLETTGVAAALNTCRQEDDAKPANERGLHIYLDLPSVLADWPWELLRWPGGAGASDSAFIIERHPIVRLVPPALPNLRWTDTTVRILLVSGQEKLDDSNNASAELRLIRKIFHKSPMSVLVEECEAPPAIGRLEERINEVAPHVLHFIGHGDLDDTVDPPEFKLQFRGATPWEWSIEQIRQFLQNNWRPRLIVLNACHSARRDERAIPVAEAQLDLGVSAVIGSQATVQIGDARRFSELFYGALAGGAPLAGAMARARYGLSRERDLGNRRRHWALPVLTVRGPADEVVRFKRTNSSVTACEIAREVYVRPGRFVNRTADRRSLLSAFHPIQPGASRFRGVILQSDGSEVGKDWLMKRSVRDFLDNDFVVRHATLVGLETRTSLDVLQEWRGLAKFAASPIGAPIQGPHFAEFDEAVGAARKEPTARNMEDVFRTFKSGLQLVRGQRDVLLILARFRYRGQNAVTSRDFSEHLLEKLLLPIAAEDSEVAGLHALLIVRRHQGLEVGQPSDFDEFALQRLSAEVQESTRVPTDGFRRLRIAEFAKDQLEHHLDEFTEFIEDEGMEGARKVIRMLVQNPSWRPNQLNVMLGAVEALTRLAPGQ
jgi:hypothetical protein